MKKHLLHLFSFLALLLLTEPTPAWAQSGFFAEAPELRPAAKFENKASAYRVYRLDLAGLKTYLAKAPVEFTNDPRPAPRLQLPLPSGKTETFAICESPILAPAVAARHPDIKTYTGRATSGAPGTVRFSTTADEFNAIVLDLPGGASVYFEKSLQAGAPNAYLSYSSLDLLPISRGPGAKKGQCGVPTSTLSGPGARTSPASAARQASSGATLRTFRLAVAATGEFTSNFGNGNAASGFNALVGYVNRLVAVYRQELSVSFTLVSDANVVYTNAATDPYTPADQHQMLTQNQANLDAVVGAANYDIGHVLDYAPAGTSGGGLAQGGSACSSATKAQGVSQVIPVGGAFPVIFGDQTFNHEVGHQVGMNHSFNSSIPVCTTRHQPTSVEPGAGTTIMSYGYTCSDGTGSDDYEAGYLPLLNFHAVNIQEANEFLATTSCYTSTNPGNATPVIGTFTTGRTIPKSTPFALSSTATDANAADVLSYSWEGMDVGAVTAPGPGVLSDETQAPFFRTYAPVANGTRTFPRLAAILDGTNKGKGDKLPSVSQVVNLRLTVRDGVGGVNEANSVITVDGGSGPFLITSNLAGSYPGNTPQTVTWSVNNTTAAPVSCANVDILLSTDGGLTFPIMLLAATPNDGSQPVTMPALATPTTTARLKVQASNNIFFDISNADFAITAPLNTLSTSSVSGSPFCAGAAVSVAYTSTGTYAAGNTFVAQLSDASGAFGAPVTIGTLSGVDATGAIAAVIPAGTGAGTGYRIRVVASTPAVTSADNGANLTVSVPAVATFSYGAASTYCASQTAAQAAVAGTGATLGAFSASPGTGLTLNATTGAITPSTSTPGTYTVTNTVAASGGCGTALATTSITITAPQIANFGYAAAGYCTSATSATAAALSSGATAGVFTSTTGLTLDAATGAITPATSTPGTYVVTNTLAASGACAATAATSTVTITAPQSAAFAYPASSASYCVGVTSPLTPALGSAAVAGTFALANGTGTGATIDARTGVVNLGAATAGTYTVTNTLAATGGCAVVVATQTLTVLPLPATPVLQLAATTLSVQGGAVVGSSYQFLRNGVAVGPASAAATYQLASGAADGQYTVVVTNANGCVSAPSAAVIVGALAVTGAQTAGALLVVYPNPAPLGGWARIELHDWLGSTVTLTLYDDLGRAVREASAAPAGTTRLNLTGLAAGMYLLRAQAAGQQASRRVVVE